MHPSDRRPTFRLTDPVMQSTLGQGSLDEDSCTLRRCDLTVCVAAICEGNTTVIGACDRMVSAGAIEYEPERYKIVQISKLVAAMTAGDAAAQVEVFARVFAELRNRFPDTHDPALEVQDVVEMYRYYLAALRRRRAEIHFLEPLGLTLKSFMETQQDMAPAVVEELRLNLTNFYGPQAGAIFAGIDSTGPHLFIVRSNGGAPEVTCCDSIGFAAIGSGSTHANSTFMLARHTAWSEGPDALLLTFSAKRRSEIAPGVGQATDMFLISADTPYLKIADELVQRLEAIDQTILDAMEQGQENAKKEIRGMLKELENTPPATDDNYPLGQLPPSRDSEAK